MIAECATIEVVAVVGEGAAQALRLRTHHHRPLPGHPTVDPKHAASAGAVAAVVAGK